MMKLKRHWMVTGMVTVGLLLTMSGVIQAAVEEEKEPVNKKIAVVIDDLGNDMLGTPEMMELSLPFAAAVMPFMPTTKRDAEWAHRLGHEVLIHMPMEPVRGKKSWLGPGAITADLS